MKRLYNIPIALISLLLFACAGKPSPPVAQPVPEPVTTVVEPLLEIEGKLPVDPAVISGVLDNGLHYLIRVNQKPEDRAELRLAVNTGSVMEDDDQQGLAHLVEHMAFNGTEHFAKQELVDYLESIGMRFGPDLNAYTSFDETVYMLKVPTDSVEMVKTAFQILEDWARAVSFDPEEIDKERGVVIEEWRLGRGAEARMRDKQFPILFKDSKYAVRLPIGRKAVIDTASYETIKRFYRDWYRPDLMAVIAVGDFDPDWMEGLIKEHFSSLSRADSPRERTAFPVPDHEENLVAIASDPEATHSRVSVYYKQDIKDENTYKAYWESIITNLYNGMLNQRLVELTKQPEPPFLYGYSGQGRFVRTKDVYFLGAMVQDNGIEQGLQALLVEAERVARHGFTSAELERRKLEFLRQYEKAYEERDKTESRSYASEYVRHYLTDEPIPGIEVEYELHQHFLPEIQIEEVNRLVQEFITDQNRVILVNLPEKEGILVPDQKSLLAIFSEVDSMAIEPYQEELSDLPLVANIPNPGTIVSKQKIEALELHEWTLDNGVRVFLKPTDFKNDEVLFTAYSPGGHSLISDRDYVSGMTAAAVTQEGGLGPFNQIELQKQLAGKIVRVSSYIGDLQEGLSGSASPQDLETMFQLIYLTFTSPRKDSTTFLAYLERMKGFLANRNASPEATFRDTLQVTMAQYHHRARPWSLELLQEMNLGRSFMFYQDRFMDAGDFTFFLVGNFDVEEIKPLVLTYLGGLPAINRMESWRDVGIDPPHGVVTKKVLKGMEPKSRVEIIFTGAFEWNRQNRYDLVSMVRALRIKLREVLREDLGGTYGVRVSARPSHYPDEECRIKVSFGTDPERAVELTAVVFAQIDSLKSFGTTEKYLTKVKETQRREREIKLKENRFWLNMLKFYDYHEEDPLGILTYDELVAGLSLEAIQSAARQYFDMTNYVQVTLYPEEGVVEK